MDRLQTVPVRSGRVWALFGDSAFGLSLFVQRMLRGAAARSPAGCRFNLWMAGVRVSVENAFAELLGRWRFVGTKRLQVLGSMPVGKHIDVAV